jgi:hypothetical protein
MSTSAVAHLLALSKINGLIRVVIKAEPELL